MTKKEAVQILAILKAAYPASYNNMTKEEASGTVSVWAIQFATMPVDIVMMAVQKLISTNKFPPTVAEVKEKIKTIHWEAYDILTENDIHQLLSEDAKAQYKRIYDETMDYKMGKFYEPKIPQMISSGYPLQIGGE